MKKAITSVIIGVIGVGVIRVISRGKRVSRKSGVRRRSDRGASRNNGDSRGED